ncbi:MAG: flagellar biosynthetic protein FliO [Rubrivivax sp.]|nr:flagellar biosynthetic protein FliO [Rubrivivax sp.]
MAPSWASLLWFAAIVAAIPVVLWLLKRTPVGGGTGAATGSPRPVAVLPLSASQRLVTVEVGQGEQRQWLVLGVTPQGITALHTMPAQAQAEGSALQQPQAAFAQLLRRLHPGGAADHAR